MSVLQDPDGSLSSFAVTRDGSKLLGVECKNMKSEESVAVVWDITDFNKPSLLLSYECVF